MTDTDVYADVRLVLMYELVDAHNYLVHLALVPAIRFHHEFSYDFQAWPTIEPLCGHPFPYDSWDVCSDTTVIPEKSYATYAWCPTCSATKELDT